MWWRQILNPQLLPITASPLLMQTCKSHKSWDLLNQTFPLALQKKTFKCFIEQNT